MTDTVDLVIGVVALNDGRLVGRTRLQKTVYLLDQLGLDSGLQFDYFHYGPYSDTLGQATVWGKMEKRLVETEQSTNQGEVYSVFTTPEAPPESIGRLRSAQIRSYLSTMDRFTAVDLELAATLLYLKMNGYTENAEEETMARKPQKATPSRMAKAKQMLAALGFTN